MYRLVVSLLVGAIPVVMPIVVQAVTIPTVQVGSPGNATDPSTGSSYGAVAYSYRIATYEVTNDQYVEFLSAKAASDPLGLYNTNMAVYAQSGITRSGIDGFYSYAVKPNMGNKPVNFVSWYDSVRFANWLHNGQGNGDTENGAYTLLGGTATPSNGTSITRNPGATWFLPSNDEWYKAAFYQPAAQGGDADNYWNYATASNSVPALATANSVGDISNPGANVANYNEATVGAGWNGQNANVTTVGSAGSVSYYGTSDQAGNVREWTEATLPGFPVYRAFWGGSWNEGSYALPASALASHLGATTEDYVNGFRVATIPEPGTQCLAFAAVIGLWWWRRRRNSNSRVCPDKTNT